MIRRVINKTFLFALILLFFVLNEPAIAIDDGAQEVVKQYFTADLKGDRLAVETYKNIKPLISWQYEPGWDYAFIVNAAKICNINRLSNNEVLVEVRYHILGIMSGDSLSEYDFNEVIDFFVMKEGSSWKIKKPVFPPHILPSSAIKQLEDLIRTEGLEDKTRISSLKNMIERLRDMPLNP